jgi:multimeric flavodoxin WrbA
MTARNFLFLLSSTRRHGNTETLARHAAGYLPEGVNQRWLRLTDVPLPPFVDTRHDGDGRYAVPTGNARRLLDATLEATDLVIASPLYWYSVTASTKLYLDHWAGWMRTPGFDFKTRMGEKTLWVISAITEEEESMADPMIGTLRTSIEYFGGTFGGALLGYANRPGDMATNTRARRRAADFFAVARDRPSAGTPQAIGSECS